MAEHVLNWAIVGTGDVSRFIASDLAQVEGVRRNAVHSRDGARAKAFCEEFGFDRAFVQLDDLLGDPDVDVVYVATPHATHAAIAVRALEAGKHVLIEKPLAVDAVEGERIAAAARATDRFAMEAMWMKFNRVYGAMLADVRRNAIGETRSVRASFGLPFGRANSTRWSADRSSSTLLDQGVYPVTLALDVLGAPDRISADGTVRPDGVDVGIHVTFDYADGRFAQLGASMTEYVEPTASVSGSDGWITIAAPFWASTSYETRRGPIARALFEPNRTEHERRGFGYVPMLESVNEAILDGHRQHPLHPLTSSIAALQLLQTIKQTMTADNSETREIR
ncbi:Gfo/Idh/MocA family protein [Agromyces sp. Soil535]|uniref:Gfo/Idh/MocA family protein n=1 Tax=Agromyces sp. Soil535 TaxID=1736390 RepID=UPI00138EEEF0|nr:Gfo/Idh/MocA family oxidoreductase [Agromyces sp. Soil535]